MNIGVTGDIHGDLMFKRIYKAKRLGYDTLIICGDFGHVWDGSIKEQKQIDYLSKIGVTILFCDGNHENHILLNDYSKIKKYGGIAHKIRDNIFHLIRGEYYNIDGNTIWVMGGANSTDKEYRTENKTWWKEEIPNQKELQHGLNTLKDNNNKVDYIITHTSHSEIIKNICNGDNYRIDELTEWFKNNIKDKIDYKHWYFGHMHTNYVCKDWNDTCLYNIIIKLGDSI